MPENGFGEEVDLIVWGHEHDCRIDPEPVTGKGYYISQPGSSVATSLAAGEAIPKHVGLLKIQNKAFDLTKIRLKTVRPFVMDDLVLADVEEIEDIKLETKVQVNKYLKKRVGSPPQTEDYVARHTKRAERDCLPAACSGHGAH